MMISGHYLSKGRHILDKQYVESIMNEWIIIINWFKTSEIVHRFITTALFCVAKR